MGHVISNRDIGRMIGLSHSGVSRIRTGNRLPSLETMRRIESAFDWALTEQAELHKRGRYDYARAFNDAISRYERGRTCDPAVSA